MTINVTNVGIFQGDNANTVVCSLTAVGGIPAGSLILVLASTDGSFGGAPFDSVSNTYNNVSLGSAFTQVWYVWNSKALTSAQSISFSAGGNQCAISIIYATGVRISSNPYDTLFAANSNGAVGGGTSPSVTSAAAPASANSLIVGVYGAILAPASQGLVLHVPAGFTGLPQNSSEYDFGVGGGAYCGGAYQVGSSTTTYNPTVNNPPASARIALMAFAPPQILNVSVSEAGSLADTETAHAIFRPSDTEAGALADSVAGTVIINQHEFMTADDSDDALLLPSGIVTDTLTAIDHTDTIDNVFVPSVNETMNAQDTSTSTVHGRQVTEIMDAQDVTNVQAIFRDSMFEPSSALDHSIGGTTFHLSVAETMTIADQTDGFKNQFVEIVDIFEHSDANVHWGTPFAVNETMHATDETDVIQFDVSIFEPITTIDVVDKHVNFGVVSVFEAMNAQDFSGLQVLFALENAALADRSTSTGNWFGLVAEVANLEETQNFRLIRGGAVVEAGDLQDHEDATSTHSIQIETMNAQDVVDTFGDTFHVSVNETADLQDFPGQENVNVFETANLTDVALLVPLSNTPFLVEPPVHFVSVHDAFTNRQSDPTNLGNGIFQKIPPRQPPPPRAPPKAPPVVLAPNLKFRSVHDAFTRRRSDPTNRER